MSDLIKEIKELISQKKSYLLEAPVEPTVSGRRNTRVNKEPVPSSEKDTYVGPPQQSLEPEQPKVKAAKDYKPGFNLYHGALTESFTQAQTMNGEMAEIIKKITQWAMMQVGQDEETNDVFQSSAANAIKPQEMAAIVQKAVLISLNHVAQQAIKDITERDTFEKADE